MDKTLFGFISSLFYKNNICEFSFYFPVGTKELDSWLCLMSIQFFLSTPPSRGQAWGGGNALVWFCLLCRFPTLPPRAAVFTPLSTSSYFQFAVALLWIPDDWEFAPVGGCLGEGK